MLLLGFCTAGMVVKKISAMNSRISSFLGGNSGAWRVTRMDTIIGEPLPAVRFVMIVPGAVSEGDAAWILRGITSNERYVTRDEKSELVAKQEGLGRPAARCAALIPIKKSAAWWTLSQDDRRKIFEEQSTHIKIGMGFLPAIARRLHHCRDLGSAEPFDFLTWFEYAPSDAAAFDDLTAQLRGSPEWGFVTREIDIRLELSGV